MWIGVAKLALFRNAIAARDSDTDWTYVTTMLLACTVVNRTQPMSVNLLLVLNATVLIVAIGMRLTTEAALFRNRSASRS